MGFQPPTLPSAPGWYVVSTPENSPDQEAGPMVIASNVPFAESDLTYQLADGTSTGPGWPTQTMATLPPNGVVIVASLPAPEARPSLEGYGDFTSLTPPLRLTGAEVREEWEAQPNSNVIQLVIRAVVNDRYVEVKAHFGSRNPSARVTLAAQTLLNLLDVPTA